MSNSHTHQQEEELTQFLRWFSDLEDIPLQTRRDFFAYILKHGLDEKAEGFINNKLEQLEEKSKARESELKNQIVMMEAALAVQKSPEFSLRHKIANDVNDWMMYRAVEFKEDFYAQEAVVSASEEAREDEVNLAEIEALKAGIL